MGSKQSKPVEKKNIKKEEPILKEETDIKKDDENITNEIFEENKIEIDEKPIIKPQTIKKNESYPIDIMDELLFDLSGEIFKTDFLCLEGEIKNLIFFDPKTFMKTLKSRLDKIENNFPKNYDDLKQPLENYMEIRQKNIYRENIGFLKLIVLKSKFLFGGEKFDEEVRARAKILAFLISQVKYDIVKYKENFIEMLDYDNLKMTPFPDTFFEKINDEIININIKTKNSKEINESLDKLREKFDEIYGDIDNNRNNDKEKKILKTFLAKKIHPKLIEIEKSNPPEDTDEYKKMKSMRSKMNKVYIQNLDPDPMDNDPIFKNNYKYTVIHKTKEEKKILLFGTYINTFKNELNDQIENLEENLSLSNLDYIEKLKNEDIKIKKAINKINKQNFENGVDAGTNIIKIFKSKNNDDIKIKKIEKTEIILDALQNAKNAGNNIFQIADNNIDKNDLKNQEKKNNFNIKTTTKLIELKKIKNLIDKIEKEKEMFDINGGINGLLITRDINDSNNLSMNLANVKVIY